MPQLTISNDAWTGSYREFNDWRTALAKCAGYSTVGPEGLETPIIDWQNYGDDAFEGDWIEPPSDPLLILIVHHDDEGIIHWKQAKILAERLIELLPKVSQDYSEWTLATKSFIAALQMADQFSTDLRFE